MRIQDNRNIDCPITVSEICALEHHDDTHARVILYSGFAIDYTLDDLRRMIHTFDYIVAKKAER
jgi:hypothetical protein